IGGWLGVTAAASVLRLEPGGACRRGGARRGGLASARARALGPRARPRAARPRGGAGGWGQQGWEGGVDSVTGVADASRSEVFAEAATIGALWSSLPDVSELLPASFDAGPSPLLLVPDSPGAENVRLLTDAGHVYVTVVGFSGTGNELASND